MNQPLPLDADDLRAISRARATKVTYPWKNKTHTAWCEEESVFGWSVVTDYGVPGEASVVALPRNRLDCISALAPCMDIPGAMAVEWEIMSLIHDAWINSTRARGSHWAPLPGK